MRAIDARGMQTQPTSARFVADFLGPEHDAPFDAADRLSRSYVVCSTPRSGSGLLCRGLASTGVLGTPLEYFNPIHRSSLSERWGCGRDLDPYLRALHSRRTTERGLFGAKLHWSQLVDVRAEAGAGSGDETVHETPQEFLDRLLPNATYVRIRRGDTDRQAVSLWQALNSNLWSAAAGERVEPVETPYNFEGIEGCRRQIETAELCWDRLLRTLCAKPLVVEYEALASSYEATIVGVARHLAGSSKVDVPPPSTRVISDERSSELLGRFREDRGRVSAADRAEQ
jgi:LPS sulfotransferase NodH